MSNIGVIYHDEVINQILYKDPPPRPKSPMLVSDRVKYYKCLAALKPKRHLTMGEAIPKLRPPCDYLKKREAENKLIEKNNICKLESTRVAEKMKRNEDKSIEHLKKTKKTNLVPKSRDIGYKMVVDTNIGHKTRVVENSHVNHPHYGKVPDFIVERKLNQYKEEERYRIELENVKPLCTPISAEERQEVLDGIKQNQLSLQKEFLTLPMLIDTIPKLIRKTKLEAQLEQIDKDADLIERNPFIYIYD